MTTTLESLMAQLPQLRQYYRLKKQWQIGHFWRRRARLKLKANVKKTALAPIVYDAHDAILYPSNAQDAVSNGVLYRGDGIGALRWVLQRYINPGALCIDVGANLGYVSAFMAKCVGTDGTVWCFEPNPALVPAIRNLFWLNRWCHYHLFPVALGTEKGRIAFTVNTDNHSISHIDTSGTASLQVDCHRLDDYLTRIDKPLGCIKIDVEGHEAAVLNGAKALLQAHQPVLIFESGLHTVEAVHAIRQALTDVNYRIAGVIEDWGLHPITELSAINQPHSRHVNVLALPCKT